MKPINPRGYIVKYVEQEDNQNWALRNDTIEIPKFKPLPALVDRESPGFLNFCRTTLRELLP